MKEKIITIKLILLISTLCLFTKASGQRISSNYRVLAKVQLTLGNQTMKLESGLSFFGVTGIGDARLELGINLIAGELFKRHTIKQSGLFYGYDFFSMVGVGHNTNLLGATLSEFNRSLIFEARGKGNFKGLGFGFQKEFLPGSLRHFSIRRGKFLMRFSNAAHSLDFTFMNDFKFRNLFNGEGTDFGETGSLIIGLTKIISPIKAYRAGIGIELFTPKPDYSRTPNNPINSDDGRKNVWHTSEPFQRLFYANAFIFGSYQQSHYATFAKTGWNSQKLGAYIQNTLHDGIGLNPRFPWNVTANDRFMMEASISGQQKVLYND